MESETVMTSAAMSLRILAVLAASKYQRARPIGIAAVTDSVSVTPMVTAKLIARSFIGHDISGLLRAARQIAAHWKDRLDFNRAIDARLACQTRPRAHR